MALTETTWTPAQEADVFLVDFSFSFHIGFHGIFDATCSPSFDLSRNDRADDNRGLLT